QRGKQGFIYANPEDHVRYGLALCKQYQLTPSYAIYEPGFMRLGAGLQKSLPGVPAPVYRLMFSDDFTFGFPPEAWAVDAYTQLLAIEAPDSPWMVAGLGVKIDALIEHTVAQGGHVRVGLEDAPLGYTVSNIDQVRTARQRIERAGCRLASASEIRQQQKS
ncbi:MAG: 3-keto-5-aminohexanoate cleavage protein, partial [Burkholderiales bacterium]|nr:3-keto-5-aminohexanoate cleavage protein [Burkholderiales bacterium]